MDKQRYDIPEAELLTLQLVDVLAVSKDNEVDEEDVKGNIKPNQFFGGGGIEK